MSVILHSKIIDDFVQQIKSIYRRQNMLLLFFTESPVIPIRSTKFPLSSST